MFGIATLLLIVTSPTHEVTSYQLQQFDTHAECVQQLARPAPKMADGWFANYSCVSVSGDPTDTE